MVAVSRKLKTGRVLYVGFSAGGLAAMVAANLVINTRAVLGLDMVATKGWGRK
jgi:pimeloyl-ACP methyl ester carboxylesterase